jgi:hypothetical protein
MEGWIRITAVPGEIDVVARVDELAGDGDIALAELRRCDDGPKDVERDTGQRLWILA